MRPHASTSAPDAASRMTPEEVHEFWFGDALTDPEKAKARMTFWFRATPDIDALITQRFATAVQDAASGALAAWTLKARPGLALIIVLDQFPRNTGRGTAAAFAHDRPALIVARRGVAAGFLDALTTVEQAFFLMPFQHSEDLACQREGMALFQHLAEVASSEWRPIAEEMLRYARMHLEIIERFGRFPHRNRILGRHSTPDERAYLNSNQESFGQTV
ncbi:MAG: hypothetical protein V7640_1061 [Betaproteobacteria bacterium]